MGVRGPSAVTCGMQPGSGPRWDALCAVAGASLNSLYAAGQQPAAAPCAPMLPLSPAPLAQQVAQAWPFASLQLPAAPAWQGAVPTGGPAGFAALQSAPRWHTRPPGRKRPAGAAQHQSPRPTKRTVGQKRSASSRAVAQPPAAPAAPHALHGWPGALPQSPSTAMLHGCLLAELAPLKPDSSLLAAASVPVPTLPAPRPVRARLSASGSCGGRTTPIEDSGSASSTPRAGLSADAARLAAITARVSELLADMPAEQSAELLSVRSFLSQF